MAQLVTNVLQYLSSVPALAVYLIAAIWVGAESAGIGVPIEPLMLFVGSLATQPPHKVNVIISIIVCAMGCLLFASAAYLIGRRVGTKSITRVGRFVGLTEARAEHIELWLRHRGAVGIVIARVTPVVRTFGSYIMGAADIPSPIFAWATLAGSLIYCGVWIIIGSLVGASYTKVLDAFNRYQGVGIVVVVVVVVGYVVLHHFWGRASLQRMEEHFRRHKAALAGATVPTSPAPPRP